MNKILQKIINIIHRDRFVGEKKAKGLGRVVEGRTVTRKQVTAPTPPPRPRSDLLLERDYHRIPVGDLRVATHFDRDVEKVPRPYMKLEWNQYRGDGFVLYRIERSLDGKTWETLTEIYDQERVEYYDSKIKVETSYYYRLWVITQVAKGCSRIKRAYVRRDDRYGLVTQECLTADFEVKRVVDNIGEEVIKDGLVQKGVTVKSVGETIKNTIGISDIYNPAFDDEDGDGVPDGWSISVENNANWFLSDYSFMGKNAVCIEVQPDNTGAGYIRNEGFIPVNNEAFNKFIFYGYWANSDEPGFFRTYIYLRIEEYDKNKSLITTQDIQLDYFMGTMTNYESKVAKINSTLDGNTRYIRIGLYINLLNNQGGFFPAQFYVSYLYIAEQIPLSVLLVDDNFNLRNKRIINLADPYDPNDAVTKNYVDSNDPTLKQYDSSNRPTCNASNVGMMILYNYEDDNYYYQDIQVCMGNINMPAYGWITIKTKQTPKV